MYLKSIEILGFKSFADKTRIDLNAGITGVVGPNGCGKSNIMESVRWCLGEMSWKSLRSESMVSVIFNGTSRRSALSMADVTLTFDNAQSLLPVQYSEVSVTRRLFRSGESEYYINKVQCRLRDVRELFLDTGIGSDGYAIIDQGGVDFAMRAKPEERRALFEEAAGVSKYKAKREEALRKLDRVRYDLERLGDQIRLADERVKKLDADARKARLYQKYKAEMAEVQVRQILAEVAQSEAEIAREAETTAPARRRHGELVVAVDAEEGRFSAFSLERTKLQDEFGQVNAKIALANGAVDLLKAELERQARERAQNEQWLREGREELEKERGQAAESAPRIDEARRRVEEAAALRTKAAEDREAFAAQLSSVEADVRAAEAEMGGLREALQDAVGKEVSRGNELRDAESAQGRCEYELTVNAKDRARESAEAEAARAQAASLRGVLAERRAKADAGRAQAERLEASLADAQRTLAGLEEEGQRLRELEAQLKVKVSALEAQGGRDAYWIGAQSVVDAGLPGIRGTVQSILKVEGPRRAHVEDALGERLYAVVCEDVAAARACIQFLVDAGRGRARFLVLSSFSEEGRMAALPPQAESLLEHVRFEPAYERLVRHLLAGVYALDGTLYGDHWVCGGAGETGGRTLKLSDLAPSKDRLGALQGALSTLAGWKASAAQGLGSIEAELRAARSAQEANVGNLRAAEAELKQQEQIVQYMDEGLRDLEAEAAHMKTELERSKVRAAELGAELVRVRDEAALARSAEQEAAHQHAALREKLAGLRARQEGFDERLETLKGQENFMRSHLLQIEENRLSLLRRIEVRLQDHSKWEARLKELDGLDALAQGRIDEKHAELGGLENAGRALQDKVNAMNRDAQALEESLRAKKSERERLREELAQCDVRVGAHEARRGLLAKELAEKHQVSLEEARTKQQGEPFDPGRMQFLQRRVEELGNINMAAPEEYEALVKERDYLGGQVEDLNKAQNDLHSAINKINATTRENFRQTFSEVRDHFRRLYGVLFDGGESDLVLTDQENMLETGVDILAQPPGKKLQSISQLSGGEKTLTAIALLFSFFMVRPSPICMLDEADAALDDANVDRFVSMLRQFAGKSQFLIVSHNKKTMEACDVMYGVTMEESGVSQMISVDFRKAEGPQGAAAAQESASVSA